MFVILMIILVLFVILLAIVAMAFWVWMIVDAATRKFNNDTEKIMWILLIVLLGVIPAIVYYFTVKRPDNSGIGEKSNPKKKKRKK